jgi:hypothetical protein
MRRFLAMALLSTAGCTSVFSGAPKVPNGAAGCRAICSAYGMELTGMVAMGEYSDGCICQVPGKTVASGAAATTAAAVVMVRREQEEILRRSNRDLK